MAYYPQSVVSLESILSIIMDRERFLYNSNSKILTNTSIGDDEID